MSLFPALRALIETLFDTGMVVLYDRDLAIQVYRQAQRSQRWEVTGGSYRAWDEGGRVIYWIAVKPPLCDGECGGRTTGVTGMCYQCQCEAHADGWYDMDEGYARM